MTRARAAFLLELGGVLLIAVAGCSRHTDSPGTAAVGTRASGVQAATVTRAKLAVPRSLDLRHVDAADFATALADDPARIFAFVRDQIAFESYVGSLRGARGTLLAMAGNSVDKASLLAAMLAHAGQQVRYAHGRLAGDRATTLIQSMWDRPARAGAATATSRATVAALQDAVRPDYTLIRTQIEKAGPSRDPSPSRDALVTQTRDHYWVQWLRGGAWVDLDPCFADAVEGRTFAQPEGTADALPAALFHRFTIRVRLEEYTGDRPASREILSYTTTAAALSGVDLLLSHQPENWNGPARSMAGAVASGVAATGRIRSVLIVGKAEWFKGQPFRVRAPSGAGLGGLGDMLSGAGTRNAAAIATAEWIEIESVSPDGQTTTTVRELFDLVGPARRSTHATLAEAEVRERIGGSAAVDVTRNIYSVFVTTGAIDATHLPAAAERESSKTQRPQGLRDAMRAVSVAFIAASDALLRQTGDVVLYPDSPRVVMTEFATRNGRRIFSMDLRRDTVRAVSDGSHPEHARLAQIFHGVVDGTLERVLTARLTGGATGAGDAMSTSVLFEQARQHGIPATLIKGLDGPLPDAVPADAMARLRDDLARGYLAVAPGRVVAVGGQPRFAWWRIDAASGDTIPMVDDGLHGAQGGTEMQLTRDEATGEVLIMDQAYIGGAGPVPVEERAVLSGIEQLNSFIYATLDGGGDFIINLRPY
jgi:transglutaminase-like putative cysteine protease